MIQANPVDADALPQVLCWLTERCARIEAAMVAVEEQRAILAEWADELSGREAAVAAREARLAPRPVTTGNGPSQ